MHGISCLLSACCDKALFRHGPALEGRVVTCDWCRCILYFVHGVANWCDRAWLQLIGIIALATHMYGKATLNAPLLLKTLAVYQMAIAAIAVSTLRHLPCAITSKTVYLSDPRFCLLMPMILHMLPPLVCHAQEAAAMVSAREWRQKLKTEPPV